MPPKKVPFEARGNVPQKFLQKKLLYETKKSQKGG